MSKIYSDEWMSAQGFLEESKVLDTQKASR